jgi:putative nucleotidyltransferase with HDIG domain
MIPTEEQIKALWEKYHLPEEKRIHVTLVARVADVLAQKCQASSVRCQVNISLLRAAALLHDIDKNAEKMPGEQHPDACVRILKEEGMEEVAMIVKTHPLHAILDPDITPTTWEEKILFLADKMVKYEIIGVDKRFALWKDEHLPPQAQEILDRSYPKVKALEKELFDLTNIDPMAVVKLA